MVTSNISQINVQSVSTSDHPNIFLNHSEITTIRSRLTIYTMIGSTGLTPTGITPTDTTIQLPGWASEFAVGDYVYLDDEIIYISAIDTANNTLTVTRGTKGTIATYHDKDARLEIANSGIRLILFKNSSKKFVERIKSIHMMMTCFTQRRC